MVYMYIYRHGSVVLSLGVQWDKKKKKKKKPRLPAIRGRTTDARMVGICLPKTDLLLLLGTVEFGCVTWA